MTNPAESFPNNPESNREEAESALKNLAEALSEAERGRIINLNKPSIEAFHPDLDVTQKEGIEIILDVLKADIKYLDDERRKVADSLIIKAELYLAAHQPNDERKK